MDSARLIVFLKRLIKSSKKKIYVIMDNLSAHKSKEVEEFEKAHEKEIKIFYLPTYSPELNPDELMTLPAASSGVS